jgi:hypothetical protein
MPCRVFQPYVYKHIAVHDSVFSNQRCRLARLEWAQLSQPYANESKSVNDTTFRIGDTGLLVKEWSAGYSYSSLTGRMSATARSEVLREEVLSRLRFPLPVSMYAYMHFMCACIYVSMCNESVVWSALYCAYTETQVSFSYMIFICCTRDACTHTYA